MDVEVFNLELRKFLKRFGITSQREIERAVESALERGKLAGSEVLPVRATLTIPGVLEDVHIDGEIALSGTPQARTP
jgi:translation elongation factor EF-G